MQFNGAEFQLRTQETHSSHISDLNGPLHAHISTTYGVSEDSILNDSRYFHVVDGIVPDVMHDMLEGTTQLVMRCLIRYLVLERKMFSFMTLNKRIATFSYGAADIRNKPSEISQSTFTSCESLKQSGEKLLLVYV